MEVTETTPVGIVQMCATSDVEANLASALGLARECAVHLVLGGFHEQAADGRADNICMHLGPDGVIASLYRKIHLFDVGPWGDVIASCDGGDGFAVAEVDPAGVAEVRGRLPSLANRRAFS